MIPTNPTAFPDSRFEDYRGRLERARRMDELFGPGKGDPLRRIGRFELKGSLGRGGQGSIYVAHDPQLDRNVAIKLLDASSEAGQIKIEREARRLALFSHDNVVQVYEIGEDPDEGPFMVMELVQGTSLRDWLLADRTWKDVVDVFMAIARGLAALHDLNVVHRDIKPDNVVVDEAGKVKLVDLGIATLGVSRQPTLESDSPGTSQISGWGTPEYMAPEQHDGAAVDIRSDQYSFCVMLYEALHGHRPSQAAQSSPRPWRGRGRIPRPITRILQRGLERNPAARFESMALLATKLQHARRGRRFLLTGAFMAGAVAGGWLWATLPDDELCNPRNSALRLMEESTLGQELKKKEDVADASSKLAFAMQSYAEALDDAHDAVCDAYLDDSELEHRVVALQQLACLAEARTVFAGVVEEPDVSSDTLAEIVLGHSMPRLNECMNPSVGLDECALDQDEVGSDAVIRDAERALLAAKTKIMLGLFEDGLADVEEAIAPDDSKALGPLRGRAFLVQGRLFYEIQRYEQALESLDQAIEWSEREAPECSGVLVDALILKAKILALQKLVVRLDDATMSLARALDELDRRGDHGPRRADAFNSRGLVLLHLQERFDDADEFFQAAADIREHIPEASLDLSDTLLNRGAVLTELGRYDEALEVLDRGIRLRTQALGPKHPDLYKLYVQRGNALLRQGESEGALEAYAEALGLVAGSSSLGPSHRKFGDVCLMMAGPLTREGKFEDALGYIEQAVDVFSKLGDEKWLSEALGERAQLFIELERYDDARLSLERSLTLKASRPEVLSIERAVLLYRRGLVETYDTKGDPDEALAWFDQALDELGQDALADDRSANQSNELRMHIQLQRGEILILVSRATQAMNALEEAEMWFADNPGNPLATARARWSLAQAIVEDGKGPTARKRADSLSRKAQDYFSTQGGGKEQYARIDTWRAEHGFRSSSSSPEERGRP